MSSAAKILIVISMLVTATMPATITSEANLPASGEIRLSVITIPTNAEPKLERRWGVVVTRLCSRVHGRLEDGTTHSLTPTPMARTLFTCIPIYQPDGQLAVPADEWAALRAIVDYEGGTLEYAETVKRGFHFGQFRGLPVYEISVTMPDGVDPDELLERLHPALKDMIKRNLTLAPAGQPA